LVLFFVFNFPGLSLRSNLGLKLANAFGVSAQISKLTHCPSVAELANPHLRTYNFDPLRRIGVVG
jgi:hypothetical protein